MLVEKAMRLGTRGKDREGWQGWHCCVLIVVFNDYLILFIHEKRELHDNDNDKKNRNYNYNNRYNNGNSLSNGRPGLEKHIR